MKGSLKCTAQCKSLTHFSVPITRLTPSRTVTQLVNPHHQKVSWREYTSTNSVISITDLPEKIPYRVVGLFLSFFFLNYYYLFNYFFFFFLNFIYSFLNSTKVHKTKQN